MNIDLSMTLFIQLARIDLHQSQLAPAELTSQHNNYASSSDTNLHAGTTIYLYNLARLYMLSHHQMSVDSLRSSDCLNFYNRALPGAHCSNYQLRVLSSQSLQSKVTQEIKPELQPEPKSTVKPASPPFCVPFVIFFSPHYLVPVLHTPCGTFFWGVQPRSKVDRRILPLKLLYSDIGDSRARIH